MFSLYTVSQEKKGKVFLCPNLLHSRVALSSCLCQYFVLSFKLEHFPQRSAPSSSWALKSSADYQTASQCEKRWTGFTQVNPAASHVSPSLGANCLRECFPSVKSACNEWVWKILTFFFFFFWRSQTAKIIMLRSNKVKVRILRTREGDENEKVMGAEWEIVGPEEGTMWAAHVHLRYT